VAQGIRDGTADTFGRTIESLLWAVVLSFTSWPIYRRLLQWLGNRRTLAAVLMTLGMVLILLLPFLIVGLSLADNVKELTQATRHWIAEGPPTPPKWLAKVPVLGPKAAAYWQNLAADTAKLWAEAQRFIEPVSSWLLKIGLALGGGRIPRFAGSCLGGGASKGGAEGLGGAWGL